jgi:excisionase family DNA binding protein
MKKPKTVDPLLDVPQVAAYINAPQGTVRRLIRNGVIPVVKLGGKDKSRIRVKRSDLDALIAANYHPATSGPLASRPSEQNAPRRARREVLDQLHAHQRSLPETAHVA